MDYKEGFGSLGFSHKSGNRVRWVILFPVLYEARPTTGGKDQTSYSVGDNPMLGGNADPCRGHPEAVPRGRLPSVRRGQKFQIAVS